MRGRPMMRGRRMALSGLVAAAAVAGVAAVAYGRCFDPWHQRWGATDGELGLRLPGDELLAGPAHQITRAITVEASREDVWPWLVQLGADRGGFYTYDWLENLFGLDIHNADTIVPGWQRLEVGDMVWAAGSRTGGWVVELIVPNRALVMKVADVDTRRAVTRHDGIGFEFQWTFALRERPGGGTRLIVRERVAYGRLLTRWLMAPVGPISFVITRNTLLGVRRLVEGA